MKKRTLLLLVVVGILLICILTACDPEANSADTAAMQMSNLKAIDGKNYLVYDVDTRVVYYMFTTKESYGNSGYGYSYFSPYISENGRFCRYVNDKIVEITTKDATN